jgi:four helix bundle protein
VTYALGSGSELETHFEIVQGLGYLQGPQVKQANYLLAEVMKMLNVLVAKLEVSVSYPLQPTP